MIIAAEEDAVAENTLPYRIKPYLVQWPKTQCSIYTSILNKIYRKNIRDFLFNSLSSNTKPVIERLRRAKSVQRELAFSRMIDAKKLLYTQANDNDSIFVQGIIDLLIEEDDGFVLLDYKTDNNPDDIVREKYAVQIKLYAQAAAEILHKPIKEKYLYLFHSGKSVEMNDC